AMKLVGGVINPAALLDVIHSNNIAIRWRMYKEDAAKANDIRHGDGTTILYMTVLATEGISYKDDVGWQVTGASCVADSWDLYEVKDFDWAADTYDIYWADTGVVPASIQDDAGMNTSAGQADEFLFTGDGNATRDIWVDDFIVRNWTTNEPTWGGVAIWERYHAGAVALPCKVVVAYTG
ncbi:unnamed protein product, partial [marine sediment metagenome]